MNIKERIGAGAEPERSGVEQRVNMSTDDCAERSGEERRGAERRGAERSGGERSGAERSGAACEYEYKCLSGERSDV